MSRARFVAAARLEFLAEIVYYNEAQPGLGQRFAAAVGYRSCVGLSFGGFTFFRQYTPRHAEGFSVCNRVPAGAGWNSRFCSGASCAAAELLAVAHSLI